MLGCVCRNGSLAVAIALSAPPAGAFGASRAVEFALSRIARPASEASRLPTLCQCRAPIHPGR
jgi:hypothetical protein